LTTDDDEQTFGYPDWGYVWLSLFPLWSNFLSPYLHAPEKSYEGTHKWEFKIQQSHFLPHHFCLTIQNHLIFSVDMVLSCKM
jgi:hypothetical protein